jgi:hypothetical protein
MERYDMEMKLKGKKGRLVAVEEEDDMIWVDYLVSGRQIHSRRGDTV